MDGSLMRRSDRQLDKELRFGFVTVNQFVWGRFVLGNRCDCCNYLRGIPVACSERSQNDMPASRQANLLSAYRSGIIRHTEQAVRRTE